MPTLEAEVGAQEEGGAFRIDSDRVKELDWCVLRRLTVCSLWDRWSADEEAGE